MLTSRRVYLRRTSVTVIICDGFNAAAPCDGDVTVVETQINPDHWHDDDEKFTTSRVDHRNDRTWHLRQNITKKKAYKYMTAARLNMKQSVVGES